MLILVAVTINMAVNGGLFDYAGKAVGDTQNAIDVEQQLANGKVQIDGVWYESIDYYLTGNLHKWTRSEDTFTCSHCNATYTMGEVVNYERANAGETVTTTLAAAKSGLEKMESYPEYAIVDEDGNQIIEAQDVNWVVLGIEDTNKDGTYETLLITTETDLWVQDEEENWYGIYFYGAAAYNNAVGEINRICKELYSNSEYGQARGMTIEDVNTALNYTPTGGIYYDGSAYQYTNGLTTKLSEIEDVYNSILYQKNYKTPDGTNTEDALGDYEINGYSYFVKDGNSLSLANDVNEKTSTITEIERSTIFGSNGDYWYWLASRGVYANTDYANFGPGDVSEGDVRSYGILFSSEGVENDSNYGLRPVVSLTSKLPEVK